MDRPTIVVPSAFGAVAQSLLAWARMTSAVMVAPGTSENQPGPKRHWVKIVFGTDGKEATWDGRLSVTGGRALDLAEWAFEERDRIEPASFSWRIVTGYPKTPRASQAETMRGVMVEVEANATANVVVAPAAAVAQQPATTTTTTTTTPQTLPQTGGGATTPALLATGGAMSVAGLAARRLARRH